MSFKSPIAVAFLRSPFRKAIRSFEKPVRSCRIICGCEAWARNIVDLPSQQRCPKINRSNPESSLAGCFNALISLRLVFRLYKSSGCCHSESVGAAHRAAPQPPSNHIVIPPSAPACLTPARCAPPSPPGVLPVDFTPGSYNILVGYSSGPTT